MLWLPIILLLGPHNGIEADRGHSKIRIPVSETDKNEGTGAIETHESWKERGPVSKKINETDQNNGIEVGGQQNSINDPEKRDQRNENNEDERHESWRETDPIDEADQQSDNNGDEGHESGKKTNSIRILPDKVDQQGKNAGGVKRGSWREKDLFGVVSDEAGQQNDNNEDGRHESWKKTDSIRILPDEMDQQGKNAGGVKRGSWRETNSSPTLSDNTDLQIIQHGDGRHETLRETDRMGIRSDEIERERQGIGGSPDGTIQTLKERGLSLRRLSLGKCLTGKRDRRRSPRETKGIHTESRCQRCCRANNNPATTELVEVDTNVAVSGTGQLDQGRAIERPNRRVKQRHTSASRDGTAALFLLLIILICCGCLCDENNRKKRG